MKKYIFLLLLTSCSTDKEKPLITGNLKNGYIATYKNKILYSDDTADTTKMKVEIIKE